MSDCHPGFYFPIEFTKVKSMWFNSRAKMNEDGGAFVVSEAPALCSWLCKTLRLSFFFALTWQSQCRWWGSGGEGDIPNSSRHLKTDGALV